MRTEMGVSSLFRSGVRFGRLPEALQHSVVNGVEMAPPRRTEGRSARLQPAA
ncbi:hypothetical protein [Roseomonas harenae]|uniref:hypothetical protein n=1 Tax=Muricoccus harenae TaxID=2692566 RepID=UPI00133116B7|nr:hypothetical protein [Roseomonas harenae]